MENRTCLHCDGEMPIKYPNRIYCSPKCRESARWDRTERVPCRVCGEPTGWPKTSGRKSAAHNACSRHPCGTVASYSKRKCRCDDCKAANAQSMREYAAKRKERDGVSLYSQNRKYDGAHGHFIPRADRLAIYERDGWICQLCGGPVDQALHFNDRMAATLDHIEPQSAALIPDHSPENLRLAHRACNSRRNNKVVTEGGALRVRPDGRSTEDLARSA